MWKNFISVFHENKNRRGGLQPQYKSCRKQYYNENREKTEKYYVEDRDEVKKDYLENRDRLINSQKL